MAASIAVSPADQTTLAEIAEERFIRLEVSFDAEAFVKELLGASCWLSPF